MINILCCIVSFFLCLYGFKFCKYLSRICELRVKYYTLENARLKRQVDIDKYFDEHDGILISEGESDGKGITLESETE